MLIRRITRKLLSAIGVVMGFFILSGSLVLAETMSSTNYKVQMDVLSIGGGRSTSTNFIVEDTIGEMATGENLASTNFKACTGYQCFQSTPYLSFTVKEGLTEGSATAGAGVALGIIDLVSVKTSNGTSINSIFISAESNAAGGNVITVRDAFTGLKRASTADTIASSTATLTAGSQGFGVCVFSTAQHADSPTSLAKAAPYNGSCNKTSNHAVGGVNTSNQNILTSSGPLKGGTSEILVKAARSSTNAAGNDYQDTLTFIMTGTF
jgi:hypothetical protein